ncbi:hypothetical protein BKH46_02250 [Helicobacter sp. 12S02634-8]|uniref:DUF5408 family protein n=1 Tax=Helicobacter sp. 12S02634-8 TaxID=1476199 RepID=UPI000BA505F1|nr:DUF5408 family protein [Helicobacter sp. 12S02634-8]PAF48149.1 hypothetical protein BKH46_02250 [Helicobacter sp. 12S02634-8]
MKESEKENLALQAARRAVRIVIFIGMFAVLLVMIDIYVLLNQITATAHMSREIHTLQNQIKILEDKLDQ